jgi:hypothetical protein
MARSKSNITTDHDDIRNWAEERGASPACVKRTGRDGDVGMIRLDFPGFSGEGSLETISGDEWFEAFDKNGLALLYQESTAKGQKSNFNNACLSKYAIAHSAWSVIVRLFCFRQTAHCVSPMQCATSATRRLYRSSDFLGLRPRCASGSELQSANGPR